MPETGSRGEWMEPRKEFPLSRSAARGCSAVASRRASAATRDAARNARRARKMGGVPLRAVAEAIDGWIGDTPAGTRPSAIAWIHSPGWSEGTVSDTTAVSRSHSSTIRRRQASAFTVSPSPRRRWRAIGLPRLGSRAAAPQARQVRRHLERGRTALVPASVE